MILCVLCLTTSGGDSLCIVSDYTRGGSLHRESPPDVVRHNTQRMVLCVLCLCLHQEVILCVLCLSTQRITSCIVSVSTPEVILCVLCLCLHRESPPGVVRHNTQRITSCVLCQTQYTENHLLCIVSVTAPGGDSLCIVSDTIHRESPPGVDTVYTGGEYTENHLLV